MNLLPYTKASDLAQEATEPQWLVEGLWGDEAVGILGGEPKCCKSFLALDLAVAVASGASCLGQFKTTKQGKVLLYAAEDAPHIVKRRLKGISLARRLSLDDLDIQVITSPKLRLDLADDLAALDETLKELRPKLLILDPFVRLHRIDENSSSEVAHVLDGLRLLQRKHHVSIIVVHHSKKGGASARAGQALRGSSEFHAWGDSNLYMRRVGDGRISLSIEHRAAASPTAIPLALVEVQENLSLEIQEATAKSDLSGKAKDPPAYVIQQLLKKSSPRSFSDLKKACGIRTATLCSTLKTLEHDGIVQKTDLGFCLIQ